MPDTIIKGLTELFKPALPIDVNANIYKILNEHYQKNLARILKKATKAQLNPWTAIAAAAKKQANLLIKQLAANNAPTKQLLQVMRFQRALLEREPYFITTNGDLNCDSLILVNDPLAAFLKKTAKKSQKTPTSLSDTLIAESLTPDDLHHYWIPYSALFENLKKQDDQTLSQVDILEILTAVISEEPHRFQTIFIENQRFKEQLNTLSGAEIVQLFAHKKLAGVHFKTIFEHLRSENQKKLSKDNLIAICVTQPSALRYFCEKVPDNSESKGFIEELKPDQIATILTKKKIKGKAESYHYSVNEFYDAFSLIQIKHNQFIKQINAEDLGNLLCRLQYSTEKESKNNEIFGAIQEKLGTLKIDTDMQMLCNLLKNGDPLIISSKIYPYLSLAEKNAIQGLLISEKQEKTNSSLQKPSAVQKKLVSKKQEEINDARAIFHLSLIAKLSENPSLRNLNTMSEKVSLVIFNENQASEILTIIEKIPSQYENLSNVMIQNLLKHQSAAAIKKICASNTHIFRVLFKNKIEANESAASKLEITDLAELISNLPDKNEAITYLETIFLEKITQILDNKQLTNDKISESLLTILNTTSNANNAAIFRFIYRNRKFNFLPYINHAHLLKSFSNQLNTDDDELKVSLTYDLHKDATTSTFYRLTVSDISKIFLEAEKNHYLLPIKSINEFVGFMVNTGAVISGSVISEELNRNKDSLIDEKCFSLIFYTHRDTYQISGPLYIALYQNVTQYLKANPLSLAELILTQSHHTDFMHFFDDESISELLNIETIAKIFLTAQCKNIDLNQPLKNYLITRLLGEEDVIQRLNNFFANQNKTHSSTTGHTSNNSSNSSNSSASNSSKTHASYTDENITKAHHELIIEIHQKTYKKNTKQHQNLITFLDKDNFIHLLRYQSKHPYLKEMFSDPALLAKITDKIALELLTTVTPIPHTISEILFNKVFSRQGFQAEFKIETAISDINTNPKACAAFLLTVFSFSNRNANLSDKLTNYLRGNPDKIANIFLHGINEPDFNLDMHHLLAFIQTQDILSVLQTTEKRRYLHLAFLNISQSLLNIENKMRLIHKLTPTLSQQDILDIFTQAKKNTPEIHLPPEIRSLLVEELNFKRLPHLIRAAEKTQTDPAILKGTLETIYRTQIEHQIQNEKKFSIPAFFLCLPYAALYYCSIIGLVLHFVLPITRPSGLYAWLKHAFSPKQIEIEFTEKFNKKVWLEKIVDKTHSIGEETIISDEPVPTNTGNSSNTTLSQTTTKKRSLINTATGEIEPVFGTTNPSYTYLFPSTKERLDYKIHAVKTRVKALKSTGALFRPDKNSYFINGEEKELFLADVQKKTN